MSEQSFFTVIGDELSVEVHFDYEPPQQEIIYSDNSQPGFPANVIVNDVIVKNYPSSATIIDCLNKATMQKLEQDAFEHMEATNAID